MVLFAEIMKYSTGKRNFLVRNDAIMHIRYKDCSFKESKGCCYSKNTKVLDNTVNLVNASLRTSAYSVKSLLSINLPVASI
jgi:hypothetical protein